MLTKANYVREQGQTRPHHCHWPDCAKAVPPTKWGCAPHWFTLPKYLRDKIWRAYRIGQEIDGQPSPEYLAVMRETREWIVTYKLNNEGKQMKLLT